jgi:hypothetical protein
VLRGAVGRNVSVADEPGGARHVDNPARAAPDHLGQRFARAEKRAGEIHREHPLPQRERGLRERRAFRLPGIVHQDVDPPEAGADRRERRPHRRFVGHVDRNALRAGPAAERFDLRPEPRRVAAKHRHGRAFAGDRRGARGADAAPAAGDPACLSASASIAPRSVYLRIRS